MPYEPNPACPAPHLAATIGSVHFGRGDERMSLISVTPKRARRIGLAALALMLVAAAADPALAAANDLLVVRSTARDVKVGRLIGASDAIRVGAGEQVVLVDDTGRSVTLTGRFDGRPADRLTGAPGESGGKIAALSSLLQSRETLSGTVRSGDKTKFTKLPDPWLISVHDGGAACTRGAALIFWRADKKADAKLTVLLGAGGKKAVLPWGKDQDRVSLSANLLSGAASFKVEFDATTAEYVVHQAPASAVSPVDQAVWMAARGCKVQALTMIDVLN